MMSRSSVYRLLGAAVLACTIPARAHAQEWRFAVGGGVVSPARPTNSLVEAGPQIGVGVSRSLAAHPIDVGVEASFADFNQTPVLYAIAVSAPTGQCIDACVIVPPPDQHLMLANYFVTGRYRFGTSTLQPYVAAAAGLTQRWGTSGDAGTSHDMGMSGGGRATAGVEARLGEVGVALDVSYATVSSLKYVNHLVRYVPITLRLSF